MNDTYQCPNCQSHDIRGAKFGFNPGSLHEFSCNQCGLYEYKCSWEDGFHEWKMRWYIPLDNTQTQPTPVKKVVSQPKKTPAEKVAKVTTQIPEKTEEVYDFYVEQTETKYILHWLYDYQYLMIWDFLALLESISFPIQTLEIHEYPYKQQIVTVTFNNNTQSLNTITIHRYYLPSDSKFYDWSALFRFQKLKKLNFEFTCQWISLPNIPEGTWSELEEINVNLYVYDGYENMIGLETEQLKKLLPHVRITEEIDGPFYY